MSSSSKTLNKLRYLLFLEEEDGIRDGTVTGVQTCALPIYSRRNGVEPSDDSIGSPIAIQAHRVFLFIISIILKYGKRTPQSNSSFVCPPAGGIDTQFISRRAQRHWPRHRNRFLSGLRHG